MGIQKRNFSSDTICLFVLEDRERRRCVIEIASVVFFGYLYILSAKKHNVMCHNHTATSRYIWLLLNVLINFSPRSIALLFHYLSKAIIMTEVFIISTSSHISLFLSSSFRSHDALQSLIPHRFSSQRHSLLIEQSTFRSLKAERKNSSQKKPYTEKESTIADMTMLFHARHHFTSCACLCRKAPFLLFINWLFSRWSMIHFVPMMPEMMLLMLRRASRCYLWLNYL